MAESTGKLGPPSMSRRGFLGFAALAAVGTAFLSGCSLPSLPPSEETLALVEADRARAQQAAVSYLSGKYGLDPDACRILRAEPAYWHGSFYNGGISEYDGWWGYEAELEGGSVLALGHIDDGGFGDDRQVADIARAFEGYVRQRIDLSSFSEAEFVVGFPLYRDVLGLSDGSRRLVSGLFDGMDPFVPASGEPWLCLVKLTAPEDGSDIRKRLLGLPEAFPIGVVGDAPVYVSADTERGAFPFGPETVQRYDWSINYDAAGVVRESYDAGDA